MSVRALGRQFVQTVKDVKRALDVDHERKMKQAPIDHHDVEHLEFK